jgi:arginyl-tRNA--protein-N-Asp/Glu arginylyltransferase
MNFIYSESNPDYKNYTFPYAVWAIPNSSEEVVELYERGFLPSRNPRFCLTRSTRIVLCKFENSSRHRRTIKLCKNVETTLVAISTFVITRSIKAMCLRCAELRFGEGVVDEQRLNRIMSPDNATHVMHFAVGKKTVGLVTMNIANKIAHYNFAFYDTTQPKKSLGTFMMTATINHFQTRHFTHLYLGTCYSRNFLYKTRFPGFEFFNGAHWSSNIDELEFLIDRPQQTGHLFESSDYLKKFHPADLDVEVVKLGYEPLNSAAPNLTLDGQTEQ